MGLKAVIDTTEGMEDAFKALYKAGDGGKFFLDVEGLEDDSHPAVGALARAKKREVEAKSKAEAKVKELNDRLQALGEERDQMLKGVIPKENVEKLELSYKEKMAAKEAELSAEINRLGGSLREVLVDNVAQGLASKLASDPLHIPLFLPHISPRLAVEMGTDGKASTRVLDRDGKPSAATLEDLSKEILANPMFAAVVLGSRATGSGAAGSAGSGGASPKKPSLGASPDEWATWAKANRSGG